MKPSMVEPKVANPSYSCMDVNMAITMSKIIEKQMFKDKEPIEKKFVVD
jgi:hypothetical protein